MARELTEAEIETLKNFRKVSKITASFRDEYLFKDDNRELIILPESWTPKYIKESKLYLQLLENDPNLIVVEGRYFPIMLDYQHTDFLINSDIKFFISFMRRFEYWNCNVKWLILKLNPKLSIKYFAKHINYLKSQIHSSNDLQIVISSLLSEIEINSIHDFNDVYFLNAILNKNVQCKIAGKIYNTEYIIGYIKNYYIISGVYEDINSDIELLKKYNTINKIIMETLQTYDPHNSEKYFDQCKELIIKYDVNLPNVKANLLHRLDDIILDIHVQIGVSTKFKSTTLLESILTLIIWILDSKIYMTKRNISSIYGFPKFFDNLAGNVENSIRILMNFEANKYVYADTVKYVSLVLFKIIHMYPSYFWILKDEYNWDKIKEGDDYYKLKQYYYTYPDEDFKRKFVTG